jgi:hypothetical protein
MDLETMSRTANIGIVLLRGLCGLAGCFVSFCFHFLTVAFFLLSRRKEIPLVGDTL